MVSIQCFYLNPESWIFSRVGMSYSYSLLLMALRSVAWILVYFNIKMMPILLKVRCLQHLLIFFESFLSCIGYFFDLIRSWGWGSLLVVGNCLLGLLLSQDKSFLFQTFLLNLNVLKHGNASQFKCIYLEPLRHHLRFAIEITTDRIQVSYPILFTVVCCLGK